VDQRTLFDALIAAKRVEEVRAALEAFKTNAGAREVPFGGRPNNRGAIELAADAARSAIERVTNAHDALLELEHQRHSGTPECRSPREAAHAWLGVPMKDGLSGVSAKERQVLALNTIVRLEPGEGWQSRILTVADRGIGIEPARMKDTILSLNESNKIQKHYLAGTYGQGGSSTLYFSKYVLIASRAYGTDRIAFTLVRYEELPADEYKTGRYVYLVDGGDVLSVNTKQGDPTHGTLIRHFGYDLSNYTSSIGPKSLYGALQRVMFDPVAPIRFENQVAGWNRTIKGSRNALNGAVDQGDESARGPELDYHLPMFNVSLGDHGAVGIEYWVLARPEAKDGKKPGGKPSRNFVDDAKPIVFTHNGQNQEELTGRIIKKEADLPFLQTQGRLIVHINCDRLTAAAKRLLFSSTREKSREGFLLNLIEDELISILKSDDELRRLNEEAREQSLKEQDDAAERQMQRQVAKLLRVVGPALVDVGGSKTDGGNEPPKKRGPRAKPEPIELRDPPTYIKIVGDKEDEISFYGGQRRYIRIETDANSHYHDPDDQKKSHINVAVGDDLKIFGTSPLRGGRMRIGVQCKVEVATGTKGGIRVELYRPGQSTLSDERYYQVVDPPKPKDDNRKTAFPRIKMIPVDGPEDDRWAFVTDEIDDSDIRRHASGAEMSDGVLYVYYSTVFPRFVAERQRIEQHNPILSPSFKKRYELWLAVHALLMHDDQENSTDKISDEEAAKELSRQERCRLASIAAMVAAQEVKSGVNTEDAEDAA
jgi:predicted GIY-YIG superfamily endonuclease